MRRIPKLILFGICLIWFAWVNGEISDSVSTYQLDATWHCMQEGSVCHGNFGSIHIHK